MYIKVKINCKTFEDSVKSKKPEELFETDFLFDYYQFSHFVMCSHQIDANYIFDLKNYQVIEEIIKAHSEEGNIK